VDFETFSKSDFKRHPRLLRAGRADREDPDCDHEPAAAPLSAVNERNGEEELHLIMVDNHIPAGRSCTKHLRMNMERGTSTQRELRRNASLFVEE